MTILVTGGAGYIGSHTSLLLLQAGYEVIIVDNFSNSSYESVKRIEKMSGQKIKVYEIDMLDGCLETVFKENKIDGVIHFAGLKAVGESVEKPLMYYHNNITGTLNLCGLMEKHKVDTLVFSSSATVYGMDHESPLVESMSTSATNPYGWSKLMIEQILVDLAKANPQMSIALLRYFNPIGAHETGLIGEDPKGIPNNLMPYVTQVAVGKRDYLSVFGNDYTTPDGTGVRDYIHVMDLAQGHINALKTITTQKGVEIYNLGTGKGYSVLDIVNTFSAVTGIDIPYQISDRRPGDIATCYADVTKAEQGLKWKAARTLEDMCRDSWNWQKNNPQGYEKS